MSLLPLPSQPLIPSALSPAQPTPTDPALPPPAGATTVTAVIPYFGYKLNRRGLPISTTHHSRYAQAPLLRSALLVLLCPVLLGAVLSARCLLLSVLDVCPRQNWCTEGPLRSPLLQCAVL